jgi:hypothetical protein
VSRVSPITSPPSATAAGPAPGSGKVAKLKASIPAKGASSIPSARWSHRSGLIIAKAAAARPTARPHSRAVVSPSPITKAPAKLAWLARKASGDGPNQRCHGIDSQSAR